MVIILLYPALWLLNHHVGSAKTLATPLLPNQSKDKNQNIKIVTNVIICPFLDPHIPCDCLVSLELRPPANKATIDNCNRGKT